MTYNFVKNHMRFLMLACEMGKYYSLPQMNAIK